MLGCKLKHDIHVSRHGTKTYTYTYTYTYWRRTFERSKVETKNNIQIVFFTTLYDDNNAHESNDEPRDR